MFDHIKRIFNIADRIDSTISRMNDRLIDVECKVEQCSSRVNDIQNDINKFERYDELDGLIQRINELTDENQRLRNENSVYLKYYDIGSEATDEIKEKVFAEFELQRLQKTNEFLQAQLQNSQVIASMTSMACVTAARTSYYPRLGYYPY